MSEFRTGEAGEHAYRPALKNLFESFGNIHAVNDPKASDFGRPDFVFLEKKRSGLTLGYAEAKDINIDLAKVLKSEQMDRYAGYSNLVLTNCTQFVFLTNGEVTKSVSIGRFDAEFGSIEFEESSFSRLADELVAFFQLAPEKVVSAKKLAALMGAKARRIRSDIIDFVESENKEIIKIERLISEKLIPDLDKDTFSDLYAQTLVYGLFIARFFDPVFETFDRREARDLVPRNNPLLRTFFDHIAGASFDPRLAYIVDELCDVFRVTDVEKIVRDHIDVSSKSGDRDPVIHFYEDFLAAYDPEVRKNLGAYYTPIEAVRFILSNVDKILVEKLGIKRGLADDSLLTPDSDLFEQRHRVQILDPATGTGTFLNELVAMIKQKFVGREGLWIPYVNESLLKRITGFEILMAPYTVAHLKLSISLTDSSRDQIEQRVRIFLTNTLEPSQGGAATLFDIGLSEALSEERQLADEVKDQLPVLVVVGNPPYSAQSSNRTEYAESLVDRYKFEPGGQAKLQERKHWLNDDYVKFFAFAERLIERNEQGVLGFITNNSYLDNVTSRGMRWRLRKTFDEIYVLDLHGNSLKREVAPDGSKDENVFPIRPGVAIFFGVKTGGSENESLARVFHAELYGTRESKLAKMAEGGIPWKELSPDSELQLFVPRASELSVQSERFLPFETLFNASATGMTTAADNFIIDEDREALSRRVEAFIEGDLDEAALRRIGEFGKKSVYVPWALQNRRELSFDRRKIVPYVFRPFDIRWIYYDEKLIWRARTEVMDSLVGQDNLAMVLPRLQNKHPGAFVTAVAGGHKAFNRYDGNTFFPLKMITSTGALVSNLQNDGVERFSANLSEAAGDVEIFDYVYAVLNHAAYLKAFEQTLKTSFPPIPLPSTDSEFRELSSLGAALRHLHCGTDVDPSGSEITFPEGGDCRVDKISWVDGNVWINQEQFFGGIDREVWEANYGGFQVLQRWLQDRKTQELSLAHIERFMAIADAIAATNPLRRRLSDIEISALENS